MARAGWNVYRTGRKLLYRKEPCVPADVQAKIVLHVVPIDPAVLSIDRIRVGQWIAKEDRTLWEAELLEIGG